MPGGTTQLRVGLRRPRLRVIGAELGSRPAGSPAARQVRAARRAGAGSRARGRRWPRFISTSGSSAPCRSRRASNCLADDIKEACARLDLQQRLRFRQAHARPQPAVELDDHEPPSTSGLAGRRADSPSRRGRSASGSRTSPGRNPACCSLAARGACAGRPAQRRGRRGLSLGHDSGETAGRILVNLAQRWSTIGDRKEQVRIRVAAGGAVMPVRVCARQRTMRRARRGGQPRCSSSAI